VLLLADSFSSLVTPPVIANTNTNTNTQAATIYPIWIYTVPDEVFPGTSRNTLLQNSLAQLASYKDPPIKDLPSTNEDVRLVDVIVNNGVNSYDFESAASSFSPTNQVHPAVNNANSGMAATTSRPTSPWCKRINEHGAEAKTSGMDVR
jgi:hypothetical protein